MPVYDSSPDLCVVGCGARTAVGGDAATTAAAVRAGISVFADHPYMVDKAGDHMVLAVDPFLPAEVSGIDRFVDMGTSAALQALGPLGSAKTQRTVEVLIGLPEARPGLPTSLAPALLEGLSRSLRAEILMPSAEFIQAGHCAVLLALAEVRRRLRDDPAGLYLVGGIDSYNEAETLEWLDEADQLHSATNTWGFVPGEAAGFCLVCSGETAGRLGLAVLGRVPAAASAREAHLIKTDAVCLGEGLTQAVREVLDSLPADHKINWTVCDLNGEPYRGDEFGYMLVRTSDRYVDASDFLTPADCWGDVGAASGALFLILAVVARRKGPSRGPRTLLWTSSEDGHRAAALVTVDQFEEPQRWQ